MSRYTAQSDLDYYDPGRRSGIERSCHVCGDPVMVDRDEVYQVQIACPTCAQPKPLPICAECGQPCPIGSTIHPSCVGFRAHIARGGTLD